MQIFKSSLIALWCLCALPLVMTAQNKEEVSRLSQVSVPDTRVKIDLPEVFQFDQTQGAYLYTGAAASIAVKELNGTPFKSLLNSVTPASLEKQHMKITGSSTLQTRAGNAAQLYTAVLNATAKDGSTAEFERLIFISGNDQKSVWITVQYPVITRNLLSDVLHSCLLSVEL